MEELRAYLPSNEKLEGKNVLVTGGTTGIGRAVALYLVELGAKVMIVGRHAEELEAALADLSKISEDRVYGMIADVSEQKGIERIFKALDHRFGQIDVLINNAGLGYQSVLDHEAEEMDYGIDTNLGGYLACAREAALRMKEKGGGHIANVGSVSAVKRGGGSSVYVATKSAIQGFSASLRKELSEFKIKVTLVEPGSTATDMQEKSQEEMDEKVEAAEMLDASDIAAGIVYCLTQPQRSNIDTIQITPLLKADS